MTVSYLIIDIPEIYLITLANSALHRAESETLENPVYFLAAILKVWLSRKMLNTHKLAYIRSEISTLPQLDQNPLKTIFMSKNKVTVLILFCLAQTMI